LKIRAVSNEMSRLLSVEAPLLLRNFMFFFARYSSLLESMTIFSRGSSSESPSSDSSLDSITLKAFNDFPLYGRAIDLIYLVGSCSFRPMS